MSAPEPQAAYLFVVAQPDSKSRLLAEVGREHPALRLAYSRAGLYTFRSDAGALQPSVRLQSVFARHSGLGIGLFNTPDDVATAVRARWEPGKCRMRLHVFGRDEGEGKPQTPTEQLDHCRCRIMAQAPEYFVEDATPEVGDWVVDVIVAPPSLNNEPLYLGYHRHRRGQSPLPGGVTRQIPPGWAPSRAWSKLEEALRWASLPMRSGDVALEFGCAPGGAVVSMIDRGLNVVGVDPGQMDPRVAERALAISASFSHVACPIAALERGQVPSKVDWLLCDANLAPQVAIRYLAYWSKQLRPQLQGLVFTLKLNDQRVVDAIPQLLTRVAEFGLGQPRAVQLPSHRREIVVTAVKRSRAWHEGAR